MLVIAHIGNIPVEEWLPFLVPVIWLCLYIRRKERRRRDAVGLLPAAGEPLDENTVRHVEQEWAKTKHHEVSRAHLQLFYPPGPDGFSAAELADRIHFDRTTVERLLEELEDFDYLTMDEQGDLENRLVSLTFRGLELVEATEVALLSAPSRVSEGAGDGPDFSGPRWDRIRRRASRE